MDAPGPDGQPMKFYKSFNKLFIRSLPDICDESPRLFKIREGCSKGQHGLGHVCSHKGEQIQLVLSRST